jgi:hypothetical protein
MQPTLSPKSFIDSLITPLRQSHKLQTISFTAKPPEKNKDLEVVMQATPKQVKLLTL